MTTMRNVKVFVGGSRRLPRLNRDVKRRIDNIIKKGLAVIIGDANGADKAVQRYLHSKHYNNVLIFCMADNCRNNIGDWPTRKITGAGPGSRDFVYYSIKDRAMAEEADYGLMLWDGRSRGTLTSIVHLVRQGKPVVVYIAPRRSFYTLRQPDHLAEILGHFDPDTLHRIDRELQDTSMKSVSNRKGNAAPLFERS
jgi:hypothetical protein